MSHTCAYFSTILKASKEYTADWWRLYDFQYRQQAAATHNTDWSVVDTSLFSRCFTGHAMKVQSCTNCGSMKHDTQDCPRRKGKRPASEEGSSQPPKKPKTNICYNYNYKRPCHHSPCIWEHLCLSCQAEDHPILDCTKRSKNLPTATEHPDIISKYLSTECAKGRMLGPLPTCSIPNVHINRIDVIPKKSSPGKWRLITDQSFPPGKSVNDGINTESTSLYYIKLHTRSSNWEKGPSSPRWTSKKPTERSPSIPTTST